MQTRRVAAIGAIMVATASAYAQPAPTEPQPAPTEPQPAPAEPPPTPTGAPAAAPVAAPAGAPAPDANKPAEAKITVAGYVEAFYQAHFQDPSNRITNLRGYDNRSGSFTLSNVAVDLKGEKGPVAAHIILQIGATPSTYYLAEPALPGTGSVNASGSELWKYLQTAAVTVKGPSDTTIEAGLFPSPVGIEVLPIKDNWNWSRSNLFFGLPGYHTGARISHALGGNWTGTLHLYNGWNSVVENNSTPSVAASAGYASATTTAQLLYFGGVERPTGAPEGKPWRHLFDALVQYAVTSEVSVAVQADAGVEPNDIGTSSWAAAALYGKLALSDKLYVAVRGDYFYEKVAEGNGMTASAIFWPTKWVAEGTATLAYQPADGVSLRLEVRHDQAQSDVFFGGTVAGDGAVTPYVFNRKTQDTATLGVTAWF
jgi:Putative beta-barrel porin-2, OmpL-like. bbp2